MTAEIGIQDDRSPHSFSLTSPSTPSSPSMICKNKWGIKSQLNVDGGISETWANILSVAQVGTLAGNSFVQKFIEN